MPTKKLIEKKQAPKDLNGLDADLKAKYPEHAKLHAVKEHSQAVGSFLMWLQDERSPRVILELNPNDLVNEDDEPVSYDPDWNRVEKLLAEYFNIDQKKISAEKDAMVEDMRAYSAKGRKK